MILHSDIVDAWADPRVCRGTGRADTGAAGQQVERQHANLVRTEVQAWPLHQTFTPLSTERPPRCAPGTIALGAIVATSVTR